MFSGKWYELMGLLVLAVVLFAGVASIMYQGVAQAQTVTQHTFKWPEPVGWTGYGGGVYAYEADNEVTPFGQVLAAFIMNNPQVRVVSVITEGFSKKYESPQRTRLYLVLCEPR